MKKPEHAKKMLRHVLHEAFLNSQTTTTTTTRAAARTRTGLSSSPSLSLTCGFFAKQKESSECMKFLTRMMVDHHSQFAQTHGMNNSSILINTWFLSKNKTTRMERNKYSNFQENFIRNFKPSNRTRILLRGNTEPLQTRQFLNVLANIANSANAGNSNHRGIKFVEQRVIGYKPEQVYHVVSNVTDYKHFVPNVKDSAFVNLDKATETPPDENGFVEKKTEAYLTVGFPPFLETYTSTVYLKSPVSVKAESKNMKLFNRLINHWVIAEGPSEDTCRLTFHVDFEFSSRLYQSVANMFFDFCKF